jgi:ABC-type dipeptide/oligopeptide/nickel transport system permease subunit
VGAALLAPSVARTTPCDLASLDLLDSHLPPAFAKGGDPRFWLGTDSQGADVPSLILHELRSPLAVPILVLATPGIAFAIMSEATLSFLGFGMPPTRPSLGTLIKTGYADLFSGEWWVAISPGAALVVLLVSINLSGDWLRDLLDPRLG